MIPRPQAEYIQLEDVVLSEPHGAKREGSQGLIESVE